MKKFYSLSTDINYQLIEKMHTQFSKHLECIVSEGVQLDARRIADLYRATDPKEL